MCCALAITSRILKGDQQQVDAYLSFLKSGGSKSPLELLQMANVDPLDDRLYQEAFEYFEKLLETFESIMLKGESL